MGLDALTLAFWMLSFKLAVSLSSITFINRWSSNTLVTWCKELTHWKRPWCWERLKGRRRRGWQRMRWLDAITDSMDKQTVGDSEGPGRLECCSPWSHRVRHNWAMEQPLYQGKLASPRPHYTLPLLANHPIWSAEEYWSFITGWPVRFFLPLKT